MLVRGEKPAAFPANKAITKRDWKHSLRSKKEYPNPIKIGSQFVQHLKDYPDSTYDDLSEMFDVQQGQSVSDGCSLQQTAFPDNEVPDEYS